MIGNPRHFPIVQGIIHALIDTTTVWATFRASSLHELSDLADFYYVVFYGVLAFGGQILFGDIADVLRRPRLALLAGIVLTALCVVALPHEPITTLVLAGCGNALYHVGAGSLALYAVPGRATPPGIFVAPGALGLGLGVFLGRGGLEGSRLPFIANLAASFAISIPDLVQIALQVGLVAALAAAFAVSFVWTPPKIPYGEEAPSSLPGSRVGARIAVPFVIIAVLLLFSIAIRGFVGFAGTYGASEMTVVLNAIVVANFAGKVMGGVLADRFGWIGVSVGALLISAPILAFAQANPLAVVVGILVFQMTMPVTLAALAGMLPRKPGLAFGLASTAFIAGPLLFYSLLYREAMPQFFKPSETFHWVGILVLVFASAAVLYLALRFLRGSMAMKVSGSESLSPSTGSCADNVAASFQLAGSDRLETGRHSLIGSAATSNPGSLAHS